MVNLSGCKFVTDNAVKVVVYSCKDLEHLNLTRLPKLTEEGLTAVANAGLHKLKYLNLYASTSISNEGFESLA